MKRFFYDHNVNTFIQKGVLATVFVALMLAYGTWGLRSLNAGERPIPNHQKGIETSPQKIAQAQEFVEVHTTQDLISLFEQHAYCLDEGMVEKECYKVPDLFLATLPNDFDRHQQTIEERKKLFMQALLPFILDANAEILVERQELERLTHAYKSQKSLTLSEYQWIDQLAIKYRFRNFSYDKLDKLLERVDIIPVSMALAQAAEETGWGKSYAARIKNSVFGITLSSGVKAYKSLKDSVKGYMLNLNANPAYAKMRAIRRNLRKEGQALCALKLMDGLYYYSELHNLYIRKIKSHIRHNELARFDEAMLEPRNQDSTATSLG